MPIAIVMALCCIVMKLFSHGIIWPSHYVAIIKALYHAIAVPLYCHGIILPLLCHYIVMALSCHCRATILPWHYLAIAVPLYCHGITLPLPWHGDNPSIAMASNDLWSPKQRSQIECVEQPFKWALQGHPLLCRQPEQTTPLFECC